MNARAEAGHKISQRTGAHNGAIDHVAPACNFLDGLNKLQQAGTAPRSSRPRRMSCSCNRQGAGAGGHPRAGSDRERSMPSSPQLPSTRTALLVLQPTLSGVGNSSSNKDNDVSSSSSGSSGTSRQQEQQHSSIQGRCLEVAKGTSCQFGDCMGLNLTTYITRGSRSVGYRAKSSRRCCTRL